MNSSPLYHEKLTSNKTEALFLALTLLFLALGLWRLGAAGWDALAVLSLIFSSVFLFYSVNYRTLTISLDVQALRLKFGIITWTVPLDNIETCARDALPTFMRLGGAGVHFMFIRKRYRASFNFLDYPRVVVALKQRVGPVQDVSFSTQRPDEIQQLIQSLEQLPRLYRELADWWPVLSAPEDYAEEAAFYEQALRKSCAFEPKTLLELGSGGGNNASHLKKHFQLTLVDLAPGMLAVSQALNPECEHHPGDMRSVRLERQFDLVFIHDAIAYMTTEVDLRQAMHTAYVHCRPGGAVLFAPDHTKENFKTQTGHGGHDRGDRSLRYLDWTLPPNQDGTYLYVMAYLLREGTGEVRCILDEHRCGLFSRVEWLQWMTETGYEASAVPFVHSEIPPGDCEVFVGRKPA